MYFETNKLNVFFEETGNKQGPALVLIHAFPLSSEMWEPQLSALKKEFRVITYDLRGFGKTGGGDGQVTIELFTDDLLALLDQLKIEEAILCGLSMGGYVALRFKEHFPQRVKALVLADTKSESDNDEGKIKRADTVKAVKTKGVSVFAEGFVKNFFTPDTLASKTESVEKIKRIIQMNSALGISGALIAMAARTDTGKALSQEPVPTLILVGAEDKTTPPEAAKAMHDKCKGSKMVTIAKASHLSNWENPTEFNEALLNFLRSLPA